MGLNFGIGLPGPFSVSTPLRVLPKRRQTVRVRHMPPPAPTPDSYSGVATTIGGMLFVLSCLVGLFRAVFFGSWWGLIGWPLLGFVVCGLIVCAFGNPEYEDD